MKLTIGTENDEIRTIGNKKFKWNSDKKVWEEQIIMPDITEVVKSDTTSTNLTTSAIWVGSQIEYNTLDLQDNIMYFITE